MSLQVQSSAHRLDEAQAKPELLKLLSLKRSISADTESDSSSCASSPSAYRRRPCKRFCLDNTCDWKEALKAHIWSECSAKVQSTVHRRGAQPWSSFSVADGAPAHDTLRAAKFMRGATKTKSTSYGITWELRDKELSQWLLGISDSDETATIQNVLMKRQRLGTAQIVKAIIKYDSQKGGLHITVQTQLVGTTTQNPTGTIRSLLRRSKRQSIKPQSSM